MIRYRLHCEQGHDFDAWFRGSDAFDRQLKRKQVTCPHCASHRVTKAPMAPAIAKSSGQVASENDGPLVSGKPLMGSGASGHESVEAVAEHIREAMGRIREHIEDNFDYVGENFVNEARAIQEGEAEERDIWGEASLKEAKELTDDGIEVLPVPGKPKLSS